MTTYDFTDLVKKSHKRSVIAGGRQDDWWNDGWWIIELTRKIGYLSQAVTQMPIPQKYQFNCMADIVARIEQWMPKENLSDFYSLVNKIGRSKKIRVESDSPELIWMCHLMAAFANVSISTKSNNFGLPTEDEMTEHLALTVSVIRQWAVSIQ